MRAVRWHVLCRWAYETEAEKSASLGGAAATDISARGLARIALLHRSFVKLRTRQTLPGSRGTQRSSLFDPAGRSWFENELDCTSRWQRGKMRPSRKWELKFAKQKARITRANKEKKKKKVISLIFNYRYFNLSTIFILLRFRYYLFDTEKTLTFHTNLSSLANNRLTILVTADKEEVPFIRVRRAFLLIGRSAR